MRTACSLEGESGHHSVLWRQELITFPTTLSALMGWSPKKGIPTIGFP